MEEYVGSEEKATPELQTVATQQERSEALTVIEQPLKEGRKRKRNVEETETEQGKEDEVDEFVSNGAFVVMEKTMLHKDFIGERGFNQLISAFREMIEKKRLSLLCEHKSIGFVAVVREFYVNMVEKKERMCYVRGK